MFFENFVPYCGKNLPDLGLFMLWMTKMKRGYKIPVSNPAYV
jgi:hypothetical protein